MNQDVSIESDQLAHWLAGFVHGHILAGTALKVDQIDGPSFTVTEPNGGTVRLTIEPQK